MKGYRTPPNLQVLEFVEVQKQFFGARVGRGTGHRGGIADGLLPGLAGFPTARPSSVSPRVSLEI
jgi:hypothetical protein